MAKLNKELAAALAGVSLAFPGTAMNGQGAENCAAPEVSRLEPPRGLAVTDSVPVWSAAEAEASTITTELQAGAPFTVLDAECVNGGILMFKIQLGGSEPASGWVDAQAVALEQRAINTVIADNAFTGATYGENEAACEVQPISLEAYTNTWQDPFLHLMAIPFEVSEDQLPELQFYFNGENVTEKIAYEGVVNPEEANGATWTVFDIESLWVGSQTVGNTASQVRGQDEARWDNPALWNVVGLDETFCAAFLGIDEVMSSTPVAQKQSN